ncbi:MULTISPECIES: FecR domain-containing protein [Butyricimonas]|uniref:FecR domain-containing protein n=1 Tax=Butyricimonas TaxID=574697 RepID=UPI0007FB2716|nr:MULTISPECIES: FecR domain-containing protein [Butyricimonas]
MNQEQIDWTLIRKRIDGSLTDEERGRLECWIAGDEQRRRFVEHACRYYERELPVIDEARVSKAWQRFARDRKDKRIRSWYTWSAAAVVLLVASIGLWLSTSREISKEMPLQTIAFGNNSVRLVISDGTTIDLAAKEPGQIIIDKGVNVRLKKEALSYEDNLVAGDTLYHTVEVPRGGEYHLTLSDGSRVWLNAESRLTYPIAFGMSERRVRLEGEAYFEVESGKGRFVVETGDMNVRVLGTAFNVNAYGDEAVTRATLVHGKVEVLTAKDDLRQVLAPGEQAVLDRVSGLLDVKQVNTDLYTRWIKGQFVFRDTPLRDIMRTLARWYEIEYEFTDPELEALCFYGVISRFERVENLLEQFEKTGKVHFEYQGNKIIVKK